MATKVPGLFITGTDTGVGKTRIAMHIARDLTASGLRVGVYKPVASGCRLTDGKVVSDDAVQLWEAAGQPGELDRVCPQRFLAPLAPHLAARAEGHPLNRDLLCTGLDYWRKRSDVVLVEGVGGLMCPVDDDYYVADVVYDLDLPLVIVARNALGTINHTLQTLITAAAFCEGLSIGGIVLNQPQPPGDDRSMAFNRQELVSRCGPPVLAELAWQAEAFSDPVDWMSIARG